jgi:hypothetical protein
MQIRKKGDKDHFSSLVEIGSIVSEEKIKM